MKRFVVILVCLMLLLGNAETANAADAPVYSPGNSTIFNNPKGAKSKQLAIITQLDRTIDATPKNATIVMAQYLFDINSTTNKLIAAYKRGVHVQLLIDDAESTPQSRQVKKILGRNQKKPSFVATCKHGCMSNKPSVMHAKFYLFSTAGKSSLVSMISSANPYTGNTFTSWNNIHTIVGDKQIYNSLLQYFRDMIKDKNNANYYRTTQSGKYKIYLFPRAAKKGVNPVVQLDVLRHVKCSGAAPGYGRNGHTVIRIAMWGWTYARLDIAKKLWSLHNAGCKVEVQTNGARTNRRVMQTLLKRSKKHGVMGVYDAWVDKNHNDKAELYMHHKLLTVSGVWFGQRNTKVLYTGSQNFTGPATLTNNDMILRIKDNAIYNLYMKNLDFIRSHRTKRVSRVAAVKSVASDARIDALVNVDGDE